jgi:hypothetical protein
MVADGPAGPAGTGQVAGVSPARQQPQRQEPPPQARTPNQVPAMSAENPTDVEAAAKRLDVLLDKDAGSGPRQDVPRRGFYLNLLV